MKVKKLNLVLLAAVGTTLLAIAAYKFVPRHEYAVIDVGWNVGLFETYSVDEPAIGEWVNQADLHFRCEVEQTAAWQHCGLTLFFDWDISKGVDLSRFDAMKIRASYTGQARRVRIFFRNYNPDYSSPEDANSAKYLSLYLPTSEFEGDKVVVIKLNEFVVADWWLHQRDVPRQFRAPELGNVTTMGVDFGSYLDNVKELEFALHSLYFEGPLITEHHWYLGILVFWMVVIISIVAWQYISMVRRARIYSKVITELVSDKAHLEQESVKLQELSNLDRLTGALNRLGIEKSIDSILTGQRSKIMGLMLIDIDHFKRINDLRGHDVGDQVLKAVVEVIQDNIREHDILGRWGGEEFVLLTPNADQYAAFRIGEKLRELLEHTTFVPENPLRVTASFGVTSIHPEEGFDDAFKRADIALYKAKSHGRNCTVIEG